MCTVKPCHFIISMKLENLEYLAVEKKKKTQNVPPNTLSKKTAGRMMISHGRFSKAVLKKKKKIKK